MTASPAIHRSGGREPNANPSRRDGRTTEESCSSRSYGTFRAKSSARVSRTPGADGSPRYWPKSRAFRTRTSGSLHRTEDRCRNDRHVRDRSLSHGRLVGRKCRGQARAGGIIGCICGGVAALIAVLRCQGIIHLPFGPSSVENQIKQFADEANKGLPKQIDQFTRWDRVEQLGPGKAYSYVYTLTRNLTEAEKQCLKEDVSRKAMTAAGYTGDILPPASQSSVQILRRLGQVRTRVRP